MHKQKQKAVISVFFLFWLGSFQLAAQDREIILIGINDLTLSERERLIITFSELDKRKQLSTEKVSLDLKSTYQPKGFYFTSIDSVAERQNEITYYINKGPVSVISSLEFKPDSAVVRALKESIFIPEVNDRFSNQLIDKISLDIIEASSKNGMPFIKVIPEILAFQTGNDTIKLNLFFTLENLTTVIPKELEISGNDKISKTTIEQIAQVNPNEPYSPFASEKIKNRLNRSGYFKTVSQPSIKITQSNTFNWAVTVEEKPANQFDGIIGYVPEAGNAGSGYFTGMINIYLRNFLGNARKLNIKWLKENQNSQELYAGFWEPWVFSVPLDLGLEFYQRNQDTLYLKRNINYEAVYNVFDQWSIGASFNTEFVNILRVVKKADDPDLFNTETYLLGIKLIYDSRDNLISPTEGIKLSVSNHYGRKSIVGADSLLEKYQGSQSETVTISEMNAENYFSFAKRHVIASRINFKLLDSKNIDITDLFQFGGIQNLRGYRENQFQGNKIALISNEYRFLVGDRSYFMTFFDAGFVQSPQMDKYKLPAFSDVYPSYGFGALINSGIGNIRLIFAMGKNDTFSTSKVHIGLQNDF